MSWNIFSQSARPGPTDVPPGIPCAPEEWSRLDAETRKALGVYHKAMVGFVARRNGLSFFCSDRDRPDLDLEEVLRELVEIRHSQSMHENGGIVHCGLPKSETREDYVFLSRALLEEAEFVLANERNVHLLAALIAYAQESSEGLMPKESHTLLDSVMERISDSCDLAQQSGDCLTELFGELETGKELSPRGLRRSKRPYKGRTAGSWRRRDGAPGLDETQSVALSLYYEYLRLRKMQPDYREAATIKRCMSAYLPLTNQSTRKTYFTKQERELGMIRKSAEDCYKSIRSHIKVGAKVDMLEGLQIDAIMACIRDDRVGTTGKKRQLSKLKAMESDIRMRCDASPNELDPFMRALCDSSLDEGEPMGPDAREPGGLGIDPRQEKGEKTGGGDC